MGIKIEDLTVTFRNHVTAVNHADLEIPKGMFGLLGENGAGKTTLMRVLTTVLSPTNGTVTLDGILYSEKNFEKIRRKIGYLPQEIDLYPSLSVQECLEYMGDLSGIPRQIYRERIDHYLEKTNLSEQRRKKMKQLSGGMKRRVGLIQALLNDPEFLIVDEPTTGLDPEERIRIRNLLVDFSEGRTVLFSTHVVARGHIWIYKTKEEGTTRELEKKYHVSSKQYVGDELRMKIISETPPQVECSPCEATLEDAYIYIANREV